MTQHHRQHIRSFLSVTGCAALAATCTLSLPTGTAPAAEAPPPLGCEPISCAAEYIGVPSSTLRAHIVMHAQQTGTIGTQTVIGQLDAARARQLSAIPVAPDGSLDMSHWNVVARHDAIRRALLDQAVTALGSQLGG